MVLSIKGIFCFCCDATEGAVGITTKDVWGQAGLPALSLATVGIKGKGRGTS